MAPKSSTKTAKASSARDKGVDQLIVLPRNAKEWITQAHARNLSKMSIHTYSDPQSGSNIGPDQFLLLKVIWPGEEVIIPSTRLEELYCDIPPTHLNAMEQIDSGNVGLEFNADKTPFESNEAWNMFLAARPDRRQVRNSRPRNLRQFTLVEWAQRGIFLPPATIIPKEGSKPMELRPRTLKPLKTASSSDEDDLDIESKVDRNDREYLPEGSDAPRPNGEAMINHALLNFVEVILLCTPTIKGKMEASLQQRGFKFNCQRPEGFRNENASKDKKEEVGITAERLSDPTTKDHDAARDITHTEGTFASDPEATGEEQKANDKDSFYCYTDGYMSAMGDRNGLCAIFEVKQDQRDRSKGVKIRQQESAEMAAWILRTHNNDQCKHATQWLEHHGRSFLTNNGEQPEFDSTKFPYWRLMICQDFDILHLVLAQYSDSYVDYLEGALEESTSDPAQDTSSQSLRKSAAQPSGSKTNPEESGFLIMREVDSFRINDADGMRIFGRFISRFAREVIYHAERRLTSLNDNSGGSDPHDGSSAATHKRGMDRTAVPSSNKPMGPLANRQKTKENSPADVAAASSSDISGASKRKSATSKQKSAHAKASKDPNRNKDSN